MKWITTLWMHVHDMWSYRHEPEYLRALADTYWRTLLLVTALVIFCAAFYGGFKFLAVLGLEEGGAVLLPSGGGTALNRADLQATLDGFAVRHANYEFLKKSSPQIPDPSR